MFNNRTRNRLALVESFIIAFWLVVLAGHLQAAALETDGSYVPVYIKNDSAFDLVIVNPFSDGQRRSSFIARKYINSLVGPLYYKNDDDVLESVLSVSLATIENSAIRGVVVEEAKNGLKNFLIDALKGKVAKLPKYLGDKFGGWHLIDIGVRWGVKGMRMQRSDKLDLKEAISNCPNGSAILVVVGSSKVSPFQVMPPKLIPIR